MLVSSNRIFHLYFFKGWQRSRHGVSMGQPISMYAEGTGFTLLSGSCCDIYLPIYLFYLSIYLFYLPIYLRAVHKVRHTILDQFWLPLSHFVTHLGTPIKYVTHLGFSSQACIHVLVRGGFWLRGFVRGGFCPSPLLSEYIHCNRKLNIIFNFRFHMYENNFKSVTSHALGPLPLS